MGRTCPNRQNRTCSPRGCGGSTCTANKSRDASHGSGQDVPRAVGLGCSLPAEQALRGQQLPKACRREPVLRKLRGDKSMLISRCHTEAPPVPAPRSRQSQLPQLPKSWWELCHRHPSPQPGPAREPQRKLLGCRSDNWQPLLRAGVWSLFHSGFSERGWFPEAQHAQGKAP